MNIEKCPYCNNSKIIKHGKTAVGRRRFRCRNCNKTWIENNHLAAKPDISDIVTDYLDGKSLRELVETYQSSPLRINYKIRDFLDGCPNWEDYLDTYVKDREPRMIYLTGIEFACHTDDAGSNRMYVALAIDAMSSVVLGFEIDCNDDQKLWNRLISRLKQRKVQSNHFLTNGTPHIVETVLDYYPRANLKISYHTNYRDKEINCCLSRLHLNEKLIKDAANVLQRVGNLNLISVPGVQNHRQIQSIIFESQEDFIRRMRFRLENRSLLRLDALINSFKKRFEKFHMLKDDPTPVVNGWIAYSMLRNTDIGFSRLSLYSQIPSVTPFSNFACAELPKQMKIDAKSPDFKTFVIEIAARALELPMIFSKCEMKLEKCAAI